MKNTKPYQSAQDRYSPAEAYSYKQKHSEKAAGYQYKPPKASSND